MRTSFTVALVIAFAAPLAAAPPERVPADARAAIAAANAAWVPAMQRQDVAAIVEPYADDGVFVTPTGESVKGRAAIGQLMRDRFAKTGRMVAGTITQDGLVRVGDLIYEWGHAEMRLAQEGGAQTSAAGRYLTGWRHEADGGWRIARNLSLPGPAPIRSAKN